MANVRYNDCASTNGGVIANPDPRYQRRANTNYGTRPHAHVSSKMRSRSDLGAIAEFTVMIDGTGGVENAMGAYLCIGVDDHIGHQDRAGANYG